MQDLLNSRPNDEIDLRELFITLWVYKLFIASTCFLGIIIGIYYIQNSDKEFTSVATFKMEQDKSSGISFSGELGALAGLAGFQGESGKSSVPIDQVTGRVFIEKIDTRLNFQSDPYFNTYDSKSVDPIWKSYIKRAIGWQKSSTDAQEAMWQGIVNTFSKSVVLEETLDGSVKVVVKHVNPQRAAEIANVVMDAIISTLKTKNTNNQDEVLYYLSNTLAKAILDLEEAQS